MEKKVDFTFNRHVQFFVHCLKSLPKQYCKLETNRLTLVHFAVQSLDILGFFDNPDLLELYQVDKDHIIDWVYSLQVNIPRLPSSDQQVNYVKHSGFKGGNYLGSLIVNGCTQFEDVAYDHGNLAMTYTALCTLITLGDELSRVDRENIVKSLKFLQLADGSFQSIPLGSENDMRFLFCACCISHILDDWSGIDINSAVAYIESCRSWDGAIGLVPGQEGHGGSTFCGIASLHLMNKLDILNKDDHIHESLGSCGTWREELVYWCVSRQVSGMQGRRNKKEDTCYSFWIGGTLELLNGANVVDKKSLYKFIMKCQSDLGGFCKQEGASPDLLHSFYSLAWLSISDKSSKESILQFKLHPLDCALAMSERRLRVFR